MDSATWYGNQIDANVEGRNMGTLAVIAPLLQRMKVAEIIDQHFPADVQAEFPYGNILSVIIAARMFSPLGLINAAASKALCRTSITSWPSCGTG